MTPDERIATRAFLADLVPPEHLEELMAFMELPLVEQKRKLSDPNFIRGGQTRVHVERLLLEAFATSPERAHQRCWSCRTPTNGTECLICRR